MPGLLRDGDRLSQPEFHELYKQYPDDVKIELIGGVVHMASPVTADHSYSGADLGGLLWAYRGRTPGTRSGHNPTTILGDRSEPQPDLTLAIHCG